MLSSGPEVYKNILHCSFARNFDRKISFFFVCELNDCHTLSDNASGRITDSKIFCPLVFVHMHFLSIPSAVGAFRVR